MPEPGAADGFMWGGIGAGASQTISAVQKLQKAKSALTNEQIIQKAATLAEKKIGGTGTKKHAYAKKLIDRYQSIYGNRGLVTETSWINRTAVKYGTKGRTRIDVIDTVKKCAYDFKFTINPGKGLGQKQVNKILSNGPSFLRYVKEINP